MAGPGQVKIEVKVDGYWQCCPVCSGRGFVPSGFYGVPVNTNCERCRRCNGEGTIKTPPVEEWGCGPGGNPEGEEAA